MLLRTHRCAQCLQLRSRSLSGREKRSGRLPRSVQMSWTGRAVRALCAQRGWLLRLQGGHFPRLGPMYAVHVAVSAADCVQLSLALSAPEALIIRSVIGLACPRWAMASCCAFLPRTSPTTHQLYLQTGRQRFSYVNHCQVIWAVPPGGHPPVQNVPCARTYSSPWRSSCTVHTCAHMWRSTAPEASQFPAWSHAVLPPTGCTGPRVLSTTYCSHSAHCTPPAASLPRSVPRAPSSKVRNRAVLPPSTARRMAG